MCPLGAMRGLRFVADEPAIGAVHCHKCHHTMKPWVTTYGATSASIGWRAAGPHPSGALAGWGASASDVYDLRATAEFVAVALWAKQHAGRHGWHLTSVNMPTP
jgi:hypothetical protein